MDFEINFGKFKWLYLASRGKKTFRIFDKHLLAKIGDMAV